MLVIIRKICIEIRSIVNLFLKKYMIKDEMLFCDLYLVTLFFA